MPIAAPLSTMLRMASNGSTVVVSNDKSADVRGSIYFFQTVPPAIAPSAKSAKKPITRKLTLLWSVLTQFGEHVDAKSIAEIDDRTSIDGLTDLGPQLRVVRVEALVFLNEPLPFGLRGNVVVPPLSPTPETEAQAQKGKCQGNASVDRS